MPEGRYPAALSTLAPAPLNPYLRGQIQIIIRLPHKDDEWPPNTHMS
jgi:hypothetical protein